MDDFSLDAAGALARQAQAGFKILLNGENDPLGLPLTQACQLHPILRIEHKLFVSLTPIIRSAAESSNCCAARTHGEITGCGFTMTLDG